MDKQITRQNKKDKSKKKQGFSSTFIKQFAAELQAVQSNKREDS